MKDIGYRAERQQSEQNGLRHCSGAVLISGTDFAAGNLETDCLSLMTTLPIQDMASNAFGTC